jgi:hypothetical protein
MNTNRESNQYKHETNAIRGSIGGGSTDEGWDNKRGTVCGYRKSTGIGDNDLGKEEKQGIWGE